MYDKGLVYRGYKVMPFSTACHTPLSNFEAGQNYKEVSDPASECEKNLSVTKDIYNHNNNYNSYSNVDFDNYNYNLSLVH